MGKIEEDNTIRSLQWKKSMSRDCCIFPPSEQSHFLHLNLNFLVCEMEVMIMTYRTTDKMIGDDAYQGPKAMSEIQ